MPRIKNVFSSFLDFGLKAANIAAKEYKKQQAKAEREHVKFLQAQERERQRQVKEKEQAYLHEVERLREIELSEKGYVKVTIKSLDKYIGVLPIEIMLERSKAVLNGEKHIYIRLLELYEIDVALKEQKKRDNELQQTAENNNIGIAFEKEGNIKEAIKAYEKNIEIGYPATHSYDRLMKIYRKEKRHEDELRVIESAINVFTKENEKRANYAISQHPQLKNDIINALSTNEDIVGVFRQYPVMQYIDRAEKVKKLIVK